MASLNNDLVRFSGSITAWIEEAKEKQVDIITSVITQAGDDAVRLSPVDTGRFRGNWQVTANAPAAQSLAVYDKDGNETRTSIRRQAYAAAHSTSTSVIYLTNRLTYAQNLEYGSSQQAPAGVLGIVSRRLGSYFQKALSEVR
jgi:hypothetical protein